MLYKSVPQNKNLNREIFEVAIFIGISLIVAVIASFGTLFLLSLVFGNEVTGTAGKLAGTIFSLWVSLVFH